MPLWLFLIIKDPLMLKILQKEDIDFFAYVVEKIDDLYLRSRLADIIWVTEFIKNNKYAHIVISTYIKLPIDNNTWYQSGGANSEKNYSSIKEFEKKMA